MPKPSKSRPKQKVKPKHKDKVEPESPGFTTKKSYWLVLTLVFGVVSAVFGTVLGMGLAKTAMLVATIVVLIGALGFIRVSHSTLSFSKRATFVFIGVSVIGFGLWAAFVLLFIPQIVGLDDFFVVTSLAIFLAVGALIGDLLARSKKVQEGLFSSLD